MMTLNPAELHSYEEKKNTLKVCNSEKARGTYVRSQLQLLFKEEYSLSYRQALEKWKSCAKTICSVLAEDGSSLNNCRSIHERIRGFYAQLCSGKSADANACGTLWNSLVLAIPEDRE